MGYRLSKIYTRTGDKGDTGLGDGSRIDKDAARVAAYGTLDELNSALGVVLAQDDLPADVSDCLFQLQHKLFELGGELCIPGHTVITADDVTQLETTLDKFNETLPALKEFILPGGSKAAAHCHLARTICRRAEREMVTLARNDEVNDAALAYINRLSDLLFVVARVLARHQGGSEVLWQHERTKS